MIGRHLVNDGRGVAIGCSSETFPRVARDAGLRRTAAEGSDACVRPSALLVNLRQERVTGLIACAESFHSCWGPSAVDPAQGVSFD
jgi:hypothetical protein